MNRCPACAASISDGSLFCAACGAALGHAAPTTPLSLATTPLPHAAPSHAASEPASGIEARFVPGALLHDRYRIVGLLGRGGMGEVYRADDLKLGQAVALKFLPEALAHDADALRRFYAEVRVGRQVSHPNVCRMYDVVEIDGHPCLTMEYIDGEDLASLIRRIGRLPADKAVDFAREVAAGLAAMHEKGVIHRDLKPANILIDGQGRARITDFGIAALVDEAHAAGFAGTLVYMAPEQLAGAPPSVRTDLYALGLVLYEAFTGKRLFNVGTPGELKSLHQRSEPPSLSSAVRDIPPTVERIVQACLARDPEARPSSARVVLAALPGGDPLQAALDAGETPTPAMVAAAGQVGDLKPPIAWTLLLVALAGMVLLAALASRTTMIGAVHPALSTDRLSAKAEGVLAAFGYPSPPFDQAAFFDFDLTFLAAQASRGAGDAASARPGPILFVHRAGPQLLVAHAMPQMLFSPSDLGRIGINDPPLDHAGMTRIEQDTDGHLVEFVAVPPDRVSAVAPHVVDWTRAIALSGLDPARLRPVAPEWTPPVASDARLAWEGEFAGQPGVRFHIEAAGWEGRPVWFAVLGPWYRPHAQEWNRIAATNSTIWLSLVVGTVFMLILVAVARRNLVLGRGDRKGALRIAIVIALTLALGLIVRADHPASVFDEEILLMNLDVQAAFFGLYTWLVYIAFEPFVRRRWPRLMISWTRLLAGRWRDPMIGRDILIGALGGIAMVLVIHVSILQPWFGPARLPRAATISTLGGDRHVVFAFLQSFYQCFTFSVGALAIMWVFERVLRTRWLAVPFSLAFFGLILMVTAQITPGPEAMLFALLWFLALVRYGVVAGFACVLFAQILLGVPLTLDVHAWYAERTWITFGIFGALLAWAFWIALGGKSPFGAAFAEDRA